MPHHIFTVPCLRVIEDKSSGLVSLIDIVSSVRAVLGNTKENKLLIPPFMLFSKWMKTEHENEKEEFEIMLFFSLASKKQKKVIDKFKVELPERANDATITLNIDSIELSSFGLWVVTISYKSIPNKSWRTVCELPFMVQGERKSAGV